MKNYIELPKSDKRYRVGNIKTDNKGKARGNPETVELRPMPIPANAPIEMQLNPPLVISNELAEYLGENI